MMLLVLSLLSLLSWKLLCLLLRRSRAARMARLHPLKHCHTINTHTSFVEFPFLYQLTFELVFFRAYAIPSISRILFKAGQFDANASKRYDDTDILVKELLMHHVDGDRGSLALRRLNFIHSNYNIGNADFLYVLSVLMTLLREWCAKYGYRDLTEVEKAVHFNLWHDIGTRMGINDIPTSYAGIEAYKEEFERQNMKYSDSNHEVAEMSVKLLLNNVPTCLRPIARRIMFSVLDNRLLEALGYPEQPLWLRACSHSLLKMHGYFVRWMPPRPLSWARTRIPAGCPASEGASFNPDAMHKMSYQQYKPVFYKEGYKIKEVGAMKPGCLGEASPGQLFVPLSECGNVPWPPALCQ